MIICGISDKKYAIQYCVSVVKKITNKNKNATFYIVFKHPWNSHTTFHNHKRVTVSKESTLVSWCVQGTNDRLVVKCYKN